MQLEKLLTYFNTSPAIGLLRATNAPYLVAFLHRTFKVPQRISLPHSELLVALAAYQEELQEAFPGTLPSKAETYLNDWCSSDSRWLERQLEAGRDEPVYQLTPHTEQVLVFLENALDKDLGFVGTESRLMLVIQTLSELVVGSSDDPAARLQHLRAEQARLRDQIEKIESGEGVSKYQPAQIRERFATAVGLLRQLQGDFRAVEESFRQITVEVQQRQVAGNETRGETLGYALDAEDLLKQQDQGVSFYAFVRLLLSPSQTEHLEEVIRKVRLIEELAPQQEGLETVRRMVTLLQQESEKVMRTNHRLSATLRRLLDERSHTQRRRIAHLLRAIQSHAAQVAGSAEAQQVGVDLEVQLDIESPARRPFWVEPPRFDAVDLTGFTPDAGERLAAFRQLAALRNLDWHAMRLRIRQMLALDSAPSLHTLAETHPFDGGVVEVIAYLQIASDDGHLIDPTSTQTLRLPPQVGNERWVEVTVPHVTFLPPRRNGHAK